MARNTNWKVVGAGYTSLTLCRKKLMTEKFGLERTATEFRALKPILRRRNVGLHRKAYCLPLREESAYLLSPNPAQMTWKLEGVERAYQHFRPPFLLNTTALYQKIRNVQLRILPDDQLLAIELAKYDQKIVLEALHNCIAHQDYTRNGRIVVTERPDRLTFVKIGRASCRERV